MAKRIQMVIVVALAAAAGFGTGYELQQPPSANRPAAPQGPIAGASAAQPQPQPVHAQATSERSTSTRVPAAASTATIAPAEPAQPTPAAEQAFEQIALMISEQISTGQRTPEQQMAIAAGAAQLSLSQRRTLMEQYVGALNRGELSPSDPPPL